MTVHDDRNRAASRNTAALLASRAVVASLGWVGSIVIARMLSPTDFGQYYFVFGLLGILSIVTDLGVGRVVLARLVDEDDPDVPLVSSAFIALRVLLGLFGYAVAMAFVVLLDYPAQVVRATALAGLVVVIATPSHALTMIFQSRLKLTVVAVAESLGQVVQVALTLLVALVAPSLLVFVLPVIANELFKLFVKVRGVLRGDTGPRPARQVQLWRWQGMLIDALPLTIGTAMTTLLYKIDVILLSRLDTFESVGLYSVGYKFADALEMGTAAVVAPALTLMVAAWPHDPTAFRDRVRSSVLLLAFLASVTVAGFWSAAEPLLTGLYGDRFSAAVLSTQLLVVGACLAMVTEVGLSVLIASGRQRLYPWIGLLGLSVNVGLNLYLIPRWSFEGAAVATVITELLLVAALWLLVARTVPCARLLPLGRLAAVAASTAGVILLTEALSEVLPWLVVAGLAGLGALAAGWALDLPGARAAVLRSVRAVRRSGAS